MVDYNLSGLNHRDFEHIVQSITIKEIASGITPFGDGADGGREATFNGKMDYRSNAEVWDGYLIVQCKFKKKSLNVTDDGKWAVKSLEEDLKKFIDKKRNLPKPDYYLFVTNIHLTAVQTKGSLDKVNELLEKYKPKLGLKGYDVWGYDKLCRYIDGNHDIRKSYAAFITPGDVLSEMQNFIEGLQPNFADTMGSYLDAEFKGPDQYAKLSEAGSASSKKTSLSNVFIDLEVDDCMNANGIGARVVKERFINKTIKLSSQKLDRSSLLQHAKDGRDPAEKNKIVLIGGPGQGKSTLSQFTCQLFRAAILEKRPANKLSQEAIDLLSDLKSHCQKQKINFPTAKRFPVHVALKSFADSLAKNKCSLIDYIAQIIDKRSCKKVNRNDLSKWLSEYPWLLVLDGLDEVPSSGNRSEVLEEISTFTSQCVSLEADILIIATSRPQGYSEAFDSRYYHHQELLPLSDEIAMNYAKMFIEDVHNGDQEKQELIYSQIEKAKNKPATKRLMQSPLQVTILAIVAETQGNLPNDRWQLFHEYYHTIYKRETQRNLEFSSILSDYNKEIEKLHNEIGMSLQVLNERAGNNNAFLSKDVFAKFVVDALSNRFDNEDKTKKKVVNQIVKAALERLVFLVSPQKEEIGFEVRSLQEFMAAECIMLGKEEVVTKRLNMI